MRKKYQSINVSLTIAFLILSALVLTIATTLYLFFFILDQREAIADRHQRIARAAAKDVNNFIHNKFDILKAANNFGRLASVSRYQQKIVLEQLLGAEPSFQELILLDAQGIELQTVSNWSKIFSGKIREDTKHIEKEILSRVKMNQDYISPVYIYRLTSEPIVIIAVPVTNILKEVSEILLADVKLKYMWDLVGDIKVGRNGMAYVVDRRGNLLAFNDITLVLQGKNLLHLKEVNKFINKNELHTADKAEISKGIYGNYVVSAHAALDFPDWAVIVELPVIEAYSAVFTTISISVSVLLLSIILAVLTGRYLSTRITRPIIDLRDAAKLIGEGRLDKKIKIESGNEIGELALSFNQMVDNLNRTTVSRDSLQKEVIERKKVEASLRESENRFKDIAFSSADFIWEIDENGVYTYCSKKGEEILGYTEKEIIGKTPFDFMPGDEAERIKELFAQLKKEKDSIRDTENWHLTKDNKRICLLSNGVPIVDEDGNLKGYRGVDKDITERKEAEIKMNMLMEEMSRSNNELEQFAYVASHDLQEPLRKVNTFSEKLRKANVDKLDEKSVDYINRMQNASNRMRSLIEGLLSYSRVTTKAAPFEEVDLNKIVKNVISDLEIRIQETKAEIKKEELPVVMADPLQMRQLFQNLLSNAIKYHKQNEPPAVSIQSRKSNNNYEITVSDNGIGFNDKYSERIFGLFQRLVTRAEFEGTGIGLTICKKIVERHNGTITAKSKVGEGSKFIFTIHKRNNTDTEGLSIPRSRK